MVNGSEGIYYIHQAVFLPDFSLLPDQIAVVFSSVNNTQTHLTPLA